MVLFFPFTFSMQQKKSADWKSSTQKKCSNHDQTVTSELAVAIVYLNEEFKKGQFLNLFSVDKSNFCTLATYIESDLSGEVHKSCYSASPVSSLECTQMQLIGSASGK